MDVAVHGDGYPTSYCSAKGDADTEAEEVAIALALQQKNVRTTVSDSKSAVRNYNNPGRIFFHFRSHPG